MAQDEKKKSVFMFEMSEKTLQKWTVIQIAAILPLLLSVVFLLKFKGSILGTIAFFLILIVGIILPQVYKDMTQSHLQLQNEIKNLRPQPSEKQSVSEEASDS